MAVFGGFANVCCWFLAWKVRNYELLCFPISHILLFLSIVPVLDFVIDIFDRLYLNGSGKIPFRVYLTGKVFRRQDRGLLKVDVSG